MTDRAAKPLDPRRDLWEQQPDESEAAYGAFVRFRNMGRGERTHDRVATELGKSVQLLGRWNAQWSWRVRVMQWDRAEDLKKIDEHWEEIERMSKRHAGQAAATGSLLMGPGMAVFKLMQEKPDIFFDYFQMPDPDNADRTLIDFDRLDRVVSMAMAAARILPSVHGMERVARGIPAEIKDEAADPRAAAQQYLIGDPVKRQKAQELFALVHGHDMPALPPGVTGEDE
jgi:hypothetical protein